MLYSINRAIFSLFFQIDLLETPCKWHLMVGLGSAIEPGKWISFQQQQKQQGGLQQL